VVPFWASLICIVYWYRLHTASALVGWVHVLRPADTEATVSYVVGYCIPLSLQSQGNGTDCLPSLSAPTVPLLQRPFFLILTAHPQQHDLVHVQTATFHHTVHFTLKAQQVPYTFKPFTLNSHYTKL